MEQVHHAPVVLIGGEGGRIGGVKGERRGEPEKFPQATNDGKQKLIPRSFMNREGPRCR